MRNQIIARPHIIFFRNRKLKWRVRASTRLSSLVVVVLLDLFPNLEDVIYATMLLRMAAGSHAFGRVPRADSCRIPTRSLNPVASTTGDCEVELQR